MILGVGGGLPIITRIEFIGLARRCMGIYLRVWVMILGVDNLNFNVG
jgi:hypothetical protein